MTQTYKKGDSNPYIFDWVKQYSLSHHLYKNIPRPIASELFIILSLLQDSVNILQKAKQ